MTHHSQLGGTARPCAARSAALAGWTPRAAPASPPSPALKTTALALSTRCEARLLRLATIAVDRRVGAVAVTAERAAESRPAPPESGPAGTSDPDAPLLADLAEVLWRRGVGLYAASEAALRWRVARGACEADMDASAADGVLHGTAAGLK